MSPYISGIETRKSILEASTMLFMSKGYSNTTYKDISERACVNQGSISYHFKSKQRILQAVFDELTESVHQQLLAVFGSDVDQLPMYCLYARITWDLYFSSAAYRSFICSTASERSVDDYYNKLEMMNDIDYAKISSRSIASEETRLLIVASLGMEQELQLFLRDKTDAYNPQVIADFFLLSFSRLLGIDEQRFRATLRESEDLFSELEVAFTEQYAVAIRRKNL